MAAIAGVISCASSDLIDYWGGKMIIGGEFIGIRVPYVLLTLSLIHILSYLYTTNFLRVYKSSFIAMLNNGRKRVEISIGYRKDSIVERERKRAWRESA